MRMIKDDKGRTIKIISHEETDQTLSESDRNMDQRAVAAVEAAIHKAKVCKKPIARYDKESKSVYIEYTDGSINYK